MPTMKRLVLVSIFLWGMLFLAGCQEPEITPLTSPYDAVNELAGLSSSVLDDGAVSIGMTIIYDNQTTKELTYGEAFVIEQKNNNQWYQIPYLDEEGVAFIEIAYLLPPKTQKEWRVSWRNIYGNLEPGSYRLIKEFVGVEDEAQYYRMYPIATEFTIK